MLPKSMIMIAYSWTGPISDLDLRYLPSVSCYCSVGYLKLQSALNFLQNPIDIVYLEVGRGYRVIMKGF